jgi:F0F1-type ATP synthase membrane subunit b/b'
MRKRLTWLTAWLGREAGEGVISAAIAVLVMAFLGVAMWVAFNGIFNNAATKINDQIENIGQ